MLDSSQTEIKAPEVNWSVVLRNVSKTYSGSSSRPSLASVSLAVRKGESVGVIGRNGSGKSTLMKLIAGIEEPTDGIVRVSAKPALLGVAPILQAHLNGKQNIYVGCLAIGMSKSEASKAVEEIADWTDIGEAIDRPMATYSSGQRARLAFAISTAITPEILLIDEALSTGDAAFADKAKQRMNSLRERAGTIFLVSHIAGQIEENCSRALWIDEGKIILDSDASVVSELYAKWAKLIAEGKKKEAEVFAALISESYSAPEIILQDASGRAIHQNG